MLIPSSWFGPLKAVWFCAIAFLLLVFSPAGAHSQGFGVTKSKVVLHRKLPAVIHLTDTTVSVKALPRTAQQAAAAQLLSELLQTDILKNDNSLRLDMTSPAVVISCTITNFDVPPRQTYSRNEVVFEKGKPVQKPKTYYKVIGALDADLRVSDRSGKTLDSNSLSVKYSREFGQGTNQATDQQGLSTFFNPLKRIAKPNESVDETAAPPTAEELQQELVRRVVAQITPRLVNTDEAVEVFLARGKLDDANKLAVSGLWSRNLESLETMTPLSTPRDDAYRMYNIGVANEALGYQADDRKTAKGFFEESAINYGKAIDANPEDKIFIEAQNRIELAVTYYKKLEDRGLKAVEVSSGSNRTSKGIDAGASSGAPDQKSTVLTNGKIIEMFESGVDEPSILAAIHDAPVAQFDVSADGLIDLAKNGVKGKIPAAMRERARTAKPANAPKL